MSFWRWVWSWFSYWQRRHDYAFRFICHLRGHHERDTEWGGGADTAFCRICDWRYCIRLYGYGKVPDTLYGEPDISC